MKLNRLIIPAIFFVLIIFSITGCDPSKKWEKQEQESITSYLNSIGDTVFTKKSSGLYFLDITVGTGATPAVKDTVSIKYKGSYLDYVIFGTNYYDTTKLTFVVGNGLILKGIDEGVRYMKVGGKARMVLPSTLAYGPYGYMNIAGYTPLLFEVILVKLIPGSSK
jgi:FKBP-type peptidyl-prolyl cis-trans isomerase FkpA